MRCNKAVAQTCFNALMKSLCAPRAARSQAQTQTRREHDGWVAFTNELWFDGTKTMKGVGEIDGKVTQAEE